MTLRHRSRRGAALLTAMVIVSLVASLAAAMVWRQFRAVQIEAADRARAQAGWVLVGALDWARLILREDARANEREPVDHLGEVWAVPLAEARLSTFLAADRNPGPEADAGPEAFLSGRIEDAQSRYNLANAIEKKEPDEVEARVVERLAEAAGLSRSAVQGWLNQLRQARHASPDADDAPLRARSLEQLAWYGLEPAARAKLEAWLVLLPEKKPVNVNTAPREVLAALADGMNLAYAERIVQRRRNQPFRDVGELKLLLPELPAAALDGERIAFRSEYFFVTGRLRLDERVMEQRSLVQRDARGEVSVRRRARVSSLDEAPGGPREPLLAP